MVVLKKDSYDVKKEKMPIGKKTVDMQWLFSKKDGTKHISMRRFILKCITTEKHVHPWEHIIYILYGCGKIYVNGRWTHAEKGDVFWIPENVEHAYSTPTRMIFLCVIPNIGDKREVEEK